MEIGQPVSNVDQFTPIALESLLSRLDVLEDILCSSQKSLTESQAIAKINGLVEATQAMESTLTNLQEKYIDLQAKQNNYKVIVTNMNRVKKNQQLLGSRLELLEKNGGQEVTSDDAKMSLESRINLLEEALFSVQAFEPNAKLAKEMKELFEKNKAAEVKIKFLQKKIVDAHANGLVLRADVDDLDRRTVGIRKELDSMSKKATKKPLALKEKAVESVTQDKEDANKQEQGGMDGTLLPTESSGQ